MADEIKKALRKVEQAEEQPDGARTYSKSKETTCA